QGAGRSVRGRDARSGSGTLGQGALHHQGIDALSADAVVAAAAGDLPVAGGGVDGAGAGVVLAHLEQHPLGPAGTCLLLAPGEQRAADADPLAPGADRVQVRRVASEHDPGVAEKRALAPSLRSLSLSPVLDGEDIAAGGAA